jgi:hypothetical protein
MEGLMEQQANTAVETRKITLWDLPTEIELVVPNCRNRFSTLCQVVGGVVGIIGGFFIIFGPDKVVQPSVADITLLYIFQAVPGPIVTIFGAIFYLGTHLSMASAKKAEQIIQQQIDAKLHIPDSDIPEGHSLSFRALAKDRFVVELVEGVDADDVISEGTH